MNKSNTPRTDACDSLSPDGEEASNADYQRMMNLAEQLERDLALSIQRIAELESQLRTQAKRVMDLVMTVEVLKDVFGDKFSEVSKAMVEEALSPSPPAVEVARWAKEKAAHKAGKRIQKRERGYDGLLCEWITCFVPYWTDANSAEYRIHPDDDTPPVPEGCEIVGGSSRMCERGTKACGVNHKPVQTEEKPATVLPIPTALYSCEHCREECSWPADELHWSAKTKAWVCENCWDDDADGEHGVRLDEEMKRKPATVPLAVAEKLEDEIAKSLTKIDLYRDEFLRIKACPNVDSEITGLCDRALSDIRAHFPITIQLENAENARRTAEREAAHMKDTWRKWPKVSCDEMQRVIKGSALGDGYARVEDILEGLTPDEINTILERRGIDAKRSYEDALRMIEANIPTTQA